MLIRAAQNLIGYCLEKACDTAVLAVSPLCSCCSILRWLKSKKLYMIKNNEHHYAVTTARELLLSTVTTWIFS
jgi:hypothetical protein